MSSIATRRLQKELKELHADCPQGTSDCTILCSYDTYESISCVIGIALVKADDFENWFLTIQVLGNSLYEVSTHPLCRLGRTAMKD